MLEDRLYLPDLLVRDHALARGLNAWWLAVPGLDGGKTLWDLAGLNHGALSGMGAGSGWASTARTGGWGHLHYLGTGQQVNLAAPLTLSASNSWSISFWARQTANDANGMVMGDDTNQSDFIYLNSSSGIKVNNSTAGTFFAASLSGASRIVWSHYAVVYSWTSGTTGNLLIYYNGALLDSSGAGNFTGTFSLRCLGDGWTGNQFDFAGDLDDVQVRTASALSAAEVRALYDESRCGYPGLLRRMRGALGGANAALFRRNQMLRAGSRGAYV